jgi:hypothetical protein
MAYTTLLLREINKVKLAVCLSALSLCAFSASFAEEPQTPTEQAAAADKDSAGKAAMDKAALDKAALDKAATEKAAADAEIKTMRARGYKPVNRNGVLVYCRAEGQIGTHFQQERCSTMDQLKQAELTGKDYVKSLQQQGSPTEFKADMPGSPTH